MSLSTINVSILFFIISALIFGVVKKLRKLINQDKKKFLLYALFTLLTFALTGLLSAPVVLNDTPLSSFIGIQLIMLILGLFHLYVMYKYFLFENSNFFTEFLFSLVILLIGFTAFVNVVSNFRPSLSYVFLGAGLFYLIPQLIKQLAVLAYSIPVAYFKKWKYPINSKIKDPLSHELTNPEVISFEFQKNIDDHEVTNFRVKAPMNMEFGKLFYFFINDYNERHPQSPITFLNANSQEAYSWNFFFKPNWLGISKHLDFSKTVAQNNIKENDIIVCQRV